MRSPNSQCLHMHFSNTQVVRKKRERKTDDEEEIPRSINPIFREQFRINNFVIIKRPVTQACPNDKATRDHKETIKHEPHPRLCIVCRMERLPHQTLGRGIQILSHCAATLTTCSGMILRGKRPTERVFVPTTTITGL